MKKERSLIPGTVLGGLTVFSALAIKDEIVMLLGSHPPSRSLLLATVFTFVGLLSWASNVAASAAWKMMILGRFEQIAPQTIFYCGEGEKPEGAPFLRKLDDTQAEEVEFDSKKGWIKKGGTIHVLIAQQSIVLYDLS